MIRTGWSNSIGNEIVWLTDTGGKYKGYSRKRPCSKFLKVYSFSLKEMLISDQLVNFGGAQVKGI